MSTIKKGPSKRKSRKNKTKPFTKADGERIHAGRRLWERYQIVYTDQLRNSLIKCIKNGNSSVSTKSSNRKIIHHLIHSGTMLILVYDKKRGEIVTFLPKIT